MPDSKFYQQDHFLAKVIVCFVVILLGAVSVETNMPYLSLVFGTVMWFFGVNFVGHIIEKVRNHAHAHPRF